MPRAQTSGSIISQLEASANAYKVGLKADSNHSLGSGSWLAFCMYSWSCLAVKPIQNAEKLVCAFSHINVWNS